MADYITKIRTIDGDKQIDYNALANLQEINGKELVGNTTLSASDVGARPNTWMPSASDVGAVPKLTTVTTAGTDLNDYTEEGVYYFDSAYTPTNTPFGSNGWLEVKSGGGRAKQIWYRYGTLDSNDHNTAIRTCSVAGKWSEWTGLLTEKDASSFAPAGYAHEGHDNVIAHGSSGGWTYRKWASGIAECWMSGFEFDGLGVSSGGYNKTSLGFPFTFADTNLMQSVTIQASPYTQNLTATFAGKYTDYCEICVHNHGVDGATAVTVDLYIKGIWK
jgi:hypothetical protein